MLSTRVIDPFGYLAEGLEATGEPLGVAASSTGPALKSVGKIGDIGLGGTLSVGQVGEVDAARVVATSGLVRVALGGSSEGSLAVLADPLNVSRANGSALSSVADHLEDGALEIFGVEADGASEGLHKSAVLDAVVGAANVDIAGRLENRMLVSLNVELRWRKAYLLHNDSQDQAGIDLRILGNLENSIVHGTLLRAAVVDDHRGLLVEVEHGSEVHPFVVRWEVLLDTAIADVVVLVGITVVAKGQAGLVPLKTVTGNHRSNSAESAGLNLGKTNGDLHTLAGMGSGESGSNRAGNSKSHQRRNSEDLEIVS